MPGRENFQVTIKLPGDKSVTLPSKPITLPADAYFVWPFNMDLSGLHLRFATAQPLAILGTAAAPVYAFVAQPNIPAEFIIDDQPGLKLDSSQAIGLTTTRHDGALWLRDQPPGPTEQLRFTLSSGRSVALLLIRQEDAEDAWKIASHGTTDLLLTTEQVSIDDTATLTNLGSDNFGAQVLATSSLLRPVDPKVKFRSIRSGLMAGSPTDNPTTLLLTTTQTKPADAPASLPADFKPSNRPRIVAAAPTEADWSRAATYSIPLPKSALTDTPTEQYFLRITYTGDIARLSTNGHLLDDNFADNRPWLVGLTRFAPQLTQSGGKLTLSIYPLRPNPPIFFEPGHEPKPDTPPASLQSVELLTQYTLKLKMVTKKP